MDMYIYVYICIYIYIYICIYVCPIQQFCYLTLFKHFSPNTHTHIFKGCHREFYLVHTLHFVPYIYI